MSFRLRTLRQLLGRIKRLVNVKIMLTLLVALAITILVSVTGINGLWSGYKAVQSLLRSTRSERQLTFSAMGHEVTTLVVEVERVQRADATATTSAMRTIRVIVAPVVLALFAAGRRARTTIRALRTARQGAGPPGCVTVSVGVASIPAATAVLGALIEAADQCLYSQVERPQPGVAPAPARAADECNRPAAWTGAGTPRYRLGPMPSFNPSCRARTGPRMSPEQGERIP